VLRIRSIAGLLLVASMTAAAAQEMRTPRLSHAEADWDTISAKLSEIEGPDAAPNAIVRLNQATSTLFPNIAASPVPVLMPFDSEDLLRDRAAGRNEHDVKHYLVGFPPPPFFLSGPAGYDAAFSVYARDLPGLATHFSERLDVHISGSALLYELDEPAGMIGWPVNGLAADIPGIRRLYLESEVRYTFVRYGVPYVVAIQCFDGGTRFRKISCRSADAVAARLLRALQVAGGVPQPQPAPIEPRAIERPAAMSADFTFHPPGDLIPGSGMKGRPGRPDYTVYSNIRFPIAEAPAFANSQSFNNWGDCDQTGRVSMGRNGNAAAYRCRVNGQRLVADESAGGNYAYPWRDNFCEHRSFYVGECPGGLGHQGQDIRPSSCTQRIQGANRCEPYLHDVVAARDGMVLRAPGQAIVYVVANSPNEHVRFRYLHMSPKQLDHDSVLSGRAVREGEVIGKVGNFQRRERATTYHLHFDMQVPTKYGWVFVNPYTTLVSAYERLLGGRGREIGGEPTPTTTAQTLMPAAKPALPPPPVAANPNQSDVHSDANQGIAPETIRDEQTEPARP
jgi:Peptidase family M23